MKKVFYLFVAIAPICTFAQSDQAKNFAVNYLDQAASHLFDLSDSIWHFSEPSFGETQTVHMLQEALREAGFEIEKNICGVSSMFVASYGHEGPVIGILAEYDADHPRRNFSDTLPLPPSNHLHAAGHNLLGVGALGAALALKELIGSGKLKGTIRYYGTSAEGGLGGRTYLARDGYFDDVDLSIFWHPSPVTSANLSNWDAIIDFEIILANTQANPLEQAVEIGHGLHVIKQSHDSTELILNYLIDNQTIDIAKKAKNVKLLVRIEHADQVTALQIFKRIKQLAKNHAPRASLRVFRAVQEFIPSATANQLVQSNFDYLGDLVFSPQDEAFAENFMQALGRDHRPLQTTPRHFAPDQHIKSLYAYGSDIGDVSWLSPEMSFVVTCLPLGVNMSHWEGAVFSGHHIGKKGMLYAAKIITLSSIDYLSNPATRDHIRKEFEARTSHHTYKSIIPSGPPDLTRNTKRSH